MEEPYAILNYYQNITIIYLYKSSCTRTYSLKAQSLWNRIKLWQLINYSLSENNRIKSCGLYLSVTTDAVILSTIKCQSKTINFLPLLKTVSLKWFLLIKSTSLSTKPKRKTSMIFSSRNLLLSKKNLSKIMIVPI